MDQFQFSATGGWSGGYAFEVLKDGVPYGTLW
jgi:hypothetical protein